MEDLSRTRSIVKPPGSLYMSPKKYDPVEKRLSQEADKAQILLCLGKENSWDFRLLVELAKSFPPSPAISLWNDIAHFWLYRFHKANWGTGLGKHRNRLLYASNL